MMAGAGNVIGAVRLLDAETALMQRTGADRVRMLANTGWANEGILKEGAPAKLLALVSKGGDPSEPASCSTAMITTPEQKFCRARAEQMHVCC